MTLAQIRNAVDNRLAALLPRIQAAQEAYFAAHGRYAQFLRSHTVDPAEGASVTADNLSARPHYQAEAGTDLAAAWGLPVSLEACLWCDQYQGPDGAGYVLAVEVTVLGNTYRRSYNVGPETWRTEGWARL